MSDWLFSYGTLQLDHVQQAVFGRTVTMTPDTLAGYRVEMLAIRDPDAVATSGIVAHPALVPGDGPAIDGQLLDLDADALAAADAYEGADYVRVAASFGSGRSGWVYIRAD